VKNGAREGEPALKKNERHAIVALPFQADAALAVPEGRWLARARLAGGAPGEDLLPRILQALTLPPPGSGLAALRLWQQTGEPPRGWVAAADPVYFETRMNHVRLRAFPESELPPEDVHAIFEQLQSALGVPQAVTFASAGAAGYLRLETPIATAAVSPTAADGASPDRFLPAGPAAAGHDRLHSEVQMCLYDAAVNARRIAAGRLPVNALWFWGGGAAPAAAERALPVLFAADDVVRGYWRSSQAGGDAWPGSLGACLDSARGSFVAVVPATSERQSLLAELRALLGRGRLHRATVLFRAGASAELRRGDRFRFWRRPAGPSGGRP
jgi:hypothetical protein